MTYLIGIGCSLVALLIHSIPFGRRKRSNHLAHVDQVKGLTPRPLLEHIIHLHDTVRGQPVHRRGEQINTANISCVG